MNPQLQVWMPAILALFGSLIVVVLTAWINTRMHSAQIEAVRSEIGGLRAEMRQGFAELELRLTKQIMELDHRVERLEEQRGLIHALERRTGRTGARHSAGWRCGTMAYKSSTLSVTSALAHAASNSRFTQSAS